MIAIVAGSGVDLLPLLDRVEERLPFKKFSGLPASSVAGHAALFIRGMHAGRPLLLQCGRVHCYEGHSFADVTRTVEILAELGATRVVFTNAAGAIANGLQAGCLFSVQFVRSWPYARRAWPLEITPDFMIPGFDAEGVYGFMHGPCYETRAEVHALAHLGIDAVGMSLAPELSRCKEIGLPAAAVSIITNAAGADALSHQEVLHNAAAASRRLAQCLSAYIRR